MGNAGVIGRIRTLDALSWARILLIAQLVALTLSPPLTNLFEAVLYILVAASPALRSRVWQVLRQPLPMMALIMFAMFGIGLLYSIEDIGESIGYWTSWRRLLMLPLAMAFFDDPRWKTIALQVFVVTLGILVTVSYVAVAADWQVLSGRGAGIVVRNHATQGMLFAVGAAAAVVMFRHALQPRWLSRWALLVIALALAANVVYVGTSRSGYAVLFVIATVVGSYLLRRRYRWLTLLVPALLAAAILTSPVGTQRIQQAIDEASSYRDGDQYTSVGVRMVMWENTFKLVPLHPVIGVGTGGFSKAYAPLVEGDDSWRGVVSGDPHNQYLKLLVEQGVLGLLVLLIFIYAFFTSPAEARWRVLGLGVLLSWCVTSLFNSHFSTFAEGRFLMLWCGIMLAVPPTSKVPWRIARG